MEQSITIKIAGKDYPLKATSPEMEQLMRLAAETINQKLAVYDAKFPDKTLVDKLSFVALNETVNRMSSQKRLASLSEEARTLLADFRARYNAQLPNTRGKHPDPQAPIDPLTGSGKRYSQFPAFLRAIIYHTLKSAE